MSALSDEPQTDLDDRNTPTRRKTSSAHRQVVKKEMNKCIRNYVEELPPSYRTVIVLSELKDVKNLQIPEILRIGLDMVKIQLYRARAMLKKKFEIGCNFYNDGENGLSCEEKGP